MRPILTVAGTALMMLLLQCYTHLCSCQSYQQQLDLSTISSVGATEFKGSRLRVFEVDGAQAADPRINFSGRCSLLRYNRLYLRYQLSLALHLDDNTLAKALSTGKIVGHVTITNVNVQLDGALSSDKSQVTVLMKKGRTEGSWKLLFLCDSFSRCQDLRDEFVSYPRTLQQAVSFVPVGTFGSSPVSFPTTFAADAPSLTDCHRSGSWFVIQRRVDGNLSFVKNWNSYVKGFGNPNSNFWIGLESLFTITATKEADKVWKNPESSLCQLRIETVGIDGKRYWGQYEQFQVMGPDQNYKLRVGKEVVGSTVQSFIPLHNERPFSTYDRDHDGMLSGSCSQVFGFGGWWYGNCHSMNPNAVFVNRNTNSPVTYESVVANGKWTQMKNFVMKLKCD